MDIEWAKDGDDGKLYIVQARPETVKSRTNINVMERYLLKEKGTVWLKAAPSASALAPVRSGSFTTYQRWTRSSRAMYWSRT